MDSDYPFTFQDGCAEKPIAILHEGNFLEACTVLFAAYEYIFPDDLTCDLFKVNVLLAKNGFSKAVAIMAMKEN